MIFHTGNEDIELDLGKIDRIIELIKKENPGFHKIFLNSTDDEKLREDLYRYIYSFEVHCLQSSYLNTVQRHYTQQAIRVLRNIFSLRHESITHFSALSSLKNCFNNQDHTELSMGFAYELLFLLRALKGTTGIEKVVEEKPMAKTPEWSRLDVISKEVKDWMKRYQSGIDELVIKQRTRNQKMLKEYFGVTDNQWNNWEWQRENLIKDADVLAKFIALTDDEKSAIELANSNNIPFGITPYYLSLLDFSHNEEQFDYGVRTAAIPQMNCIKHAIELKKHSLQDSNRGRKLPPEIFITRGYPMIAIFKPMYTNSRFFCLYGEKNWEINYALSRKNTFQIDKIERAIRWFEKHTEVNEVLIAGDILVFEDSAIEEILSRLADIPHIERIRVSTRIPIILPLRITDSLIHLLTSYQITGRREISLMTHFEHSNEVSLEAMKGIQKLRKAGIHVYNQSVYTIENARRFEMAALRKQLRLIGVDPYYSFNAKKDIAEERVPIARMIQEQNEESRLAPGIDRADEAVFSIPGVGKNYLRAFQEHELIMILKDGSRVYEFYPSDVYLLSKKPFIYRDVPIYTFLNQLALKGENLRNYQSIWYYY